MEERKRKQTSREICTRGELDNAFVSHCGSDMTRSILGMEDADICPDLTHNNRT